MHGSDSTQQEHTGTPVNNQRHIFVRVFFFMLTGVGLGEVKNKSMEPLYDSHVLVRKSALSQLARLSDWCCHSFVTERNSFSLQRFGTQPQHVVQSLGLEILHKHWNNWLGCWNVYNPPSTPHQFFSLGNVLFSWYSHTGFEEFVLRKKSQKKIILILYNNFLHKNNMFL